MISIAKQVEKVVTNKSNVCRNCVGDLLVTTDRFQLENNLQSSSEIEKIVTKKSRGKKSSRENFSN